MENSELGIWRVFIHEHNSFGSKWSYRDFLDYAEAWAFVNSPGSHSPPMALSLFDIIKGYYNE